MFRLGGGVIKGKQVGNRENFQDPTPTYDSLVKDILKNYSQSQQRAKDYGTGVRNILGAQVLASAPTLSSIRSLSDIPQVLSEIGSSPQLFNALLKSRSLDLKAQDKDLSSKMKMAALLKPDTKRSTLRDVVSLSNEISKKIADAEKEGKDTKFLEKQLSKVLSADSPVEERFKILQLLEEDERLSPSSIKKMYEIFKDIDVEDFAEEIAERVSERLSGRNENLQKGLLTNLLGIGAIASMLPNKEQERLERLADKEMERAERVRRHNNRKFRKALGGR